MIAARMDGGEDAQVYAGEQPAFGRSAGGRSCAHNGAEVFAAGHGVEMLHANTRQAGNLVFGENFLSRFDGDHFALPFFDGPWGSSLRGSPTSLQFFELQLRFSFIRK